MGGGVPPPVTARRSIRVWATTPRSLTEENQMTNLNVVMVNLDEVVAEDAQTLLCETLRLDNP